MQFIPISITAQATERLNMCMRVHTFLAVLPIQYKHIRERQIRTSFDCESRTCIFK